MQSRLSPLRLPASATLLRLAGRQLKHHHRRPELFRRRIDRVQVSERTLTRRQCEQGVPVERFLEFDCTDLQV